MIPLFAALLLAASTQLGVNAQVVRSTSFSVGRAESRGSSGIRIAGTGYDTAGAVVVEASRGVEIRFVRSDAFEARGSGMVRVTLYADGAPPSDRDEIGRGGAANQAGRLVQVELRREVRSMPLDVADAR